MSENMSIFAIPEEFIRRNHNENNELPEYRTEFMRDRDRLMYATAFRRLAGKTQIYTVGTNDHKKNRLTHSLEVAQIARTISKALGLNEDLTEAIALGHDFGHTPFGHAGEEILNSIMIPNAKLVKGSPFYKKSVEEIGRRFRRECRIECDENGEKKEQECYKNCSHLDQMFGFKHNHQSVRVCAVLEDSYRTDEGKNIGLNLTNYVLYGMMLHTDAKYKGEDYPNYQNAFNEHIAICAGGCPAWSFEAYVVKCADDIAQWHHDLEDAMREGALPMDSICDTIQKALGNTLDQVGKDNINKVKVNGHRSRYNIATLAHVVVNTLVNDLVNASKGQFLQLNTELAEKNITDSKMFYSEYGELGLSIKCADVIGFSDKIDSQCFKETIRAAIHHSRNVERMNEKGKYIIRKLFEAYYAHPQQLPDGAILQVLIEAEVDGYDTVENAKKKGIGVARTEFEKIMKNPTIAFECVLMRRICDHIASMTDHYAIEEYNNLYG